jgi:hypothetical protein
MKIFYATQRYNLFFLNKNKDFLGVDIVSNFRDDARKTLRVMNL